MLCYKYLPTFYTKKDYTLLIRLPVQYRVLEPRTGRSCTSFQDDTSADCSLLHTLIYMLKRRKRLDFDDRLDLAPRREVKCLNSILTITNIRANDLHKEGVHAIYQ
jgi:hypothetical protein